MTRNIFTALALCAVLASPAFGQVAPQVAPTAPPAQIGASDPLRSFEPPLADEERRMPVVKQQSAIAIGRQITVDLPADARDIIVTNPAVVSALMRGQRKLVVIGLADGATDVTAMSHSGRTIALIRITVSRDLLRLQQVLREVMPTSNILPKSVGNSVLLTGEVDNAAQSSQAQQLTNAFIHGGDVGGAGVGSNNSNVINALSIRGRDQVMLRVTVAEVQRSVIKQLGLNTSGNWSIKNFALGATQNAAFPVAGSFLGGTNMLAGSLNNGDKSVSLQALEQADVARILAEPNLTAVSGEKAEFLVGGEIPVPTGAGGSQSTSTGNGTTVAPTIDFKKFGVSLAFTPIVLDRGRISINVATEVSEVDTTNGTTIPVTGGNSIKIPGFRIRKQTTTIELPSGASMVTAGLIQSTTRTAVKGIPGLIEIPILGALFRSRDYQRMETELMIIVTPYIAKPNHPSALPKPTDGFRDASDANATLLGQINQVDPTDPLARPPGPLPAPPSSKRQVIRKGAPSVQRVDNPINLIPTTPSAPTPTSRRPSSPPFVVN